MTQPSKRSDQNFTLEPWVIAITLLAMSLWFGEHVYVAAAAVVAMIGRATQRIIAAVRDTSATSQPSRESQG